MEANIFGERLKELRVEKGWLQSDLAKRSGLKQNTISQLENGERQPAWETVIALCDALGVTCDEFRAGYRRKHSRKPPKSADE